MDTYIKLIYGAFIIFGLYGCGNSRKAPEGAPVAFQEVFYSITEAKSSGGERMLELFLPLNSQIQSSVVLDSVYFRGRSAKLETLSQDSSIMVGKFEMQSLQADEDRIMSSDPREEYGNKPPIVLQHFPFDLESDQAMVSYQRAEQTKYFKVVGIRKQRPGSD